MKNVLDKPDISKEQKKQKHFAALLTNKEQILSEVKSNIDKNQKCQKHYFDICNEMPGNVVKKGDVVLKEKQKDKSRKGGKLTSRYNEATYTVVDIHPNANLVLKNTDTNEVLKTPVPLLHVKKYLKRKLQDEFQDSKEIEVDMEDYLNIMSDANNGETKRQRTSDAGKSDMELDEESSMYIMSEDFKISMDGN